MELKPQDLLVLLKVVAHPPQRWTYAALGAALGMSASETHACVKRALAAGLAVSQGRDGWEAHLVSPIFSTSDLGSHCRLSFWYHMWGTAMGSLHVDLWDGSSWTNSVWTLSGNQGNSWQQATVPLDAYIDGSVRVRFRGITGTGSTSDMAIDDIMITGSSGVQVSARAFLDGARAAEIRATLLGQQLPSPGNAAAAKIIWGEGAS